MKIPGNLFAVMILILDLFVGFVFYLQWRHCLEGYREPAPLLISRK